MADHWRCYEPIDDVAVFDIARGETTQVQVTARVAGADLATPIGVMVSGVCTLALTLEQADVLIERLSAARDDAARAIVVRRAGGMQQ